MASYSLESGADTAHRAGQWCWNADYKFLRLFRWLPPSPRPMHIKSMCTPRPSRSYWESGTGCVCCTRMHLSDLPQTRTALRTFAPLLWDIWEEADQKILTYFILFVSRVLSASQTLSVASLMWRYWILHIRVSHGRFLRLGWCIWNSFRWFTSPRKSSH
jgi:hypothetical protein